MINNKYNRWTVLSDPFMINRTSYIKCKCDCGTIKDVQKYHVKSGSSKSCGCIRSEFSSRKKIDLVGKKFNRLLVIKEKIEKKCKDTVWECLCDCGKIVSVRAPKLKSGSTKSCGCYTRDRFIAAGIKYSRSPEGRKANSERLKARTGPLAIHWKGGKEEDNIRLRYSVMSRDWRAKVYERDGHLCQHCFIKGKRLNAHHIQAWASHEELRFDLNNGFTLCIDCHRNEHKRIGNPKLKKVKI